ncbi:hypothetical protein AWB90_20090 [Mycobacterium paraense]|uniref:Uncharacterized protein n=1 Tax=Mycobacterium paraense TaxID=767916 RepID=A0A1X2A633_9MYCO|nr:hypothetical protein AWB90_20090 [Mycobacterium paraense]
MRRLANVKFLIDLEVRDNLPTEFRAFDNQIERADQSVCFAGHESTTILEFDKKRFKRYSCDC